MFKRIIILFCFFVLSGCKSIEGDGRVEKIRVSIPAFLSIEMDYYKDQENKNPEGMAKTTSFTPVSKEEIEIPGVGIMPKLMDMTKRGK